MNVGCFSKWTNDCIFLFIIFVWKVNVRESCGFRILTILTEFQVKKPDVFKSI